MRGWPRILIRMHGGNGHQKDTCYNEIGLCAQNMDYMILSSIRWVGVLFGYFLAPTSYVPTRN